MDTRQGRQPVDPNAEVTLEPREGAAAKRQVQLGLRDARNQKRNSSGGPRDPRLLEAQLRAARSALHHGPPGAPTTGRAVTPRRHRGRD